ncbi:hypothetical protein GCM10010412_008580 [Nonomuraea recticatena]|uniref:Uncharacterized protein n=1 Tax=Nonomuraea recticatena TaxID=46178 RepID=A0ABN3R8B8_9ACTN
MATCLEIYLDDVERLLLQAYEPADVLDLRVGPDRRRVAGTTRYRPLSTDPTARLALLDGLRPAG